MTTQKAEWLLTGGGCIQESNHRGPFPRRGPGGPGTSTLWKIVAEKMSLVKLVGFLLLCCAIRNNCP